MTSTKSPSLSMKAVHSSSIETLSSDGVKNTVPFSDLLGQGLSMEPVAVLRDVLNLDGAHDRERARLQKPLSGTGTAAGVSGNMLAQAQFEARLRGAYRSMLMQLQHRYMLERERQEELHKLQLQTQVERHSHELRERTAAHEAEITEMAQAAKRLEREASDRKSDVQRLEAQIKELRAALDASREQAQLHLHRSTHEAELQHVLQGSMPVAQHEEAVRRLKRGAARTTAPPLLQNLMPLLASSMCLRRSRPQKRSSQRQPVARKQSLGVPSSPCSQGSGSVDNKLPVAAAWLTPVD
ncbi:hypothetical protein GPECTOR_6g554 [Gonium pectorale]|uniref:Uncharacterized protein n=1 Tax=Gonium pectorale TaxID=33097 RepID=A0A150GUT4_GONPE|nr:hypothetical protein GPECTOR_6g554 [Gonium pectorale]|eukprot:KXZ53637.1 hypothetical protein GPECTOR_6g554 [Gonium pectorale]